MDPGMTSRIKIKTGALRFDALLSGGIAMGELTLFYGEPGSGKTTLAIDTAAHLLLSDPAARIIYIDSDSKFTPIRLTQMTGSKETLKRLIYAHPTTFEEQAQALDRVPEDIQKGDLICVDSITGLYRVETGEARKTFMENKELNRQLGFLKETAITSGAAYWPS